MESFAWRQVHVLPPVILIHFLSTSMNLPNRTHRLNGAKMHAAQGVGTVTVLACNYSSCPRSVCVAVCLSLLMSLLAYCHTLSVPALTCLSCEVGLQQQAARSRAGSKRPRQSCDLKQNSASSKQLCVRSACCGQLTDIAA